MNCQQFLAQFIGVQCVAVVIVIYSYVSGDACFSTHISLKCDRSTSHSVMCFPGLSVSLYPIDTAGAIGRHTRLGVATSSVLAIALHFRRINY